MRPNVKGWMTKQHNLQWVGSFADAAFTSLPILSVLNSVSVLVVLYQSIKEYLIGDYAWLNLWTFSGIVLLLVTITMVLVYKFVLKSLWSWRSQQMQGMNKQLDDIKLELGKLRKELAEKGVK
jgi:peptidoglycan biosynthesis protein MviN/MurJ (putative lipid II flippase)